MQKVVKSIESTLDGDVGSAKYQLQIAGILLIVEAVKTLRMWRDYNFSAYEDEYQEQYEGIDPDEVKEDYE
jgi:hypothetical protein